MASFMSAITLLGVTQENYTYGTQFVLINISYFIATPIAAYVYLPVFFRMQNTSAYAYLENRFGYATRLAASAAFTLQMTLYMGKLCQQKYWKIILHICGLNIFFLAFFSHAHKMNIF